MSKQGMKPEKEGELDKFGGRPSSMEEHKGPFLSGHSNASTKGKGWHGFGKSIPKSSYKEGNVE